MQEVQKQSVPQKVLDQLAQNNKAWEVNILDIKSQGYFFTEMEIYSKKFNLYKHSI